MYSLKYSFFSGTSERRQIYRHEGEGINCKYTMDQLRRIIDKASFSVVKYWTNENVAALFLENESNV